MQVEEASHEAGVRSEVIRPKEQHVISWESTLRSTPDRCGDRNASATHDDVTLL
jgi:hypothetical protein